MRRGEGGGRGQRKEGKEGKGEGREGGNESHVGVEYTYLTAPFLGDYVSWHWEPRLQDLLMEKRNRFFCCDFLVYTLSMALTLSMTLHHTNWITMLWGN